MASKPGQVPVELPLGPRLQTLNHEAMELGEDGRVVKETFLDEEGNTQEKPKGPFLGISDSLVLLHSLRQTRALYTTTFFPLFSTRSKLRIPPPAPPPPNAITPLGSCTLQIGPCSFECRLYDVRFLSEADLAATRSAVSVAEPKKLKEKKPTAPKPAPKPAPRPVVKPAAKPPLKSVPPLTKPSGATPVPAPQLGAPATSAAPGASAKPAARSSAVTPELIKAVNAAAQSNPQLAKVLQAAASGKATSQELQYLGGIINKLQQAGASQAAAAAGSKPAATASGPSETKPAQPLAPGTSAARSSKPASSVTSMKAASTISSSAKSASDSAVVTVNKPAVPPSTPAPVASVVNPATSSTAPAVATLAAAAPASSSSTVKAASLSSTPVVAKPVAVPAAVPTSAPSGAPAASTIVTSMTKPPVSATKPTSTPPAPASARPAKPLHPPSAKPVHPSPGFPTTFASSSASTSSPTPTLAAGTPTPTLTSTSTPAPPVTKSPLSTVQPYPPVILVEFEEQKLDRFVLPVAISLVSRDAEAPHTIRLSCLLPLDAMSAFPSPSPRSPTKPGAQASPTSAGGVPSVFPVPGPTSERLRAAAAAAAKGKAKASTPEVIEPKTPLTILLDGCGDETWAALNRVWKASLGQEGVEGRKRAFAEQFHPPPRVYLQTRLLPTSHLLPALVEANADKFALKPYQPSTRAKGVARDGGDKFSTGGGGGGGGGGAGGGGGGANGEGVTKKRVRKKKELGAEWDVSDKGLTDVKPKPRKKVKVEEKDSEATPSKAASGVPLKSGPPLPSVKNPTTASLPPAPPSSSIPSSSAPAPMPIKGTTVPLPSSAVSPARASAAPKLSSSATLAAAPISAFSAGSGETITAAALLSKEVPAPALASEMEKAAATDVEGDVVMQ